MGYWSGNIIQAAPTSGSGKKYTPIVIDNSSLFHVQ